MYSSFSLRVSTDWLHVCTDAQGGYKNALHGLRIPAGHIIK